MKRLLKIASQADARLVKEPGHVFRVKVAEKNPTRANELRFVRRDEMNKEVEKRQRSLKGWNDSTTAKELRDGETGRVRETTDAVRGRVQAMINKLQARRKDKNSTISWRSYETIVFELAASGNVRYLEKILEFMKEDNVQETPQIIAARIRCHRYAKDPSSAERLYTQYLSTHPSPSKLILKEALALYTSLRNTQKSIETFKKISKPTTAHFNMLLNGCDSYQSALDVLNLLTYRGAPIDVLSCNAVLNMCAEKGDMSACETILNEMLGSSSVAPTDASYTILIKCYAKRKEVEKVLEAKARMLSNGVKPSHFTYATVLSALYHAPFSDDHLQSSVKIFNEFLATPNIDNTRIWGKMAEIYGKHQKELHLNTHIKTWVEKGPRLTSGSLKVIKSAYTLCGSERVSEVELLINERNAYYKEARNDLKPHTQGDTVKQLVEQAEKITEPPEETPSEAIEEKLDRTAVVFGVLCGVTEAMLLAFLRQVGEVKNLLVLYTRPDTLARVYVTYGSREQRDKLVARNKIVFRARPLKILATTPIFSPLSPHMTALLKLPLDTKEARIAGLHETPLSKSRFIRTPTKRIERYSTISRGRH